MVFVDVCNCNESVLNSCCQILPYLSDPRISVFRSIVIPLLVYLGKFLHEEGIHNLNAITMPLPPYFLLQ